MIPLRTKTDPDGWISEEREEHVTFVHWRVSPNVVANRLPAGLEPDTFHGDAYLTVATRRVAQLRLRPAPALSFGAAFPAIEIRTYVRRGGVRGIWPFSLDAPGGFEAWLGRHERHLPYSIADVEFAVHGDTAVCAGVRHDGATFTSTSRPVGTVQPAGPRTLAMFLHERYSTFVSEPGGGFGRGDVAHEPWPLQTAEVQVDADALFDAAQLPRPSHAPIAWYASGVDRRTWPLVHER